MMRKLLMLALLPSVVAAIAVTPATAKPPGANGLISFAAGPRFFGVSPARPPRSWARRHSTRLDEYSPSRRSRAPISPGFVQAAASSRIFRLYSAVNRRRRGFEATSVSCAMNPISEPLLTVRSKLALLH